MDNRRNTIFTFDRLAHYEAAGDTRITRNEHGQFLFEGHPVLTGDSTEFNGTVSLGASPREAILIDDRESTYAHIYAAAYTILIERLQEKTDSGLNYKHHVFDTLIDTIREIFPHRSVAALHTFLDQLGTRSHDTIVNLGTFMESGTGVCRHTSALGGYLAERLRQEGWIEGEVRLKRASVEDIGSHAWLEYTNSLGTIYVLDPMFRVIAPKQDLGDAELRDFYHAIDDTPELITPPPFRRKRSNNVIFPSEE